MWWAVYILLPGNKEEKSVMWAGGQSRNSSETLRISCFESQGARAGLWSLSALPLESVDDKDTCTQSFFLNTKALPGFSCTNTTLSPSHSWSLPWFRAPGGSWGERLQHQLPELHPVCVGWRWAMPSTAWASSVQGCWNTLPALSSKGKKLLT